MPKNQRKTIIGFNEVSPDFDSITLQWIFEKNNEDLPKFLAYHNLIKNKINCDNCTELMGLIKKKMILRGVKFVKRQSLSVMDPFSKSKLPISKLVPLIYM